MAPNDHIVIDHCGRWMVAVALARCEWTAKELEAEKLVVEKVSNCHPWE